LVTINHLLPSLTRKVDWPEQKRKVILVGIRGEVPQRHGGEKRPLIEPVPAGSVVLGYELGRSLGLSPGDKTELKGRSFTVQKCHPERGTADDVTVWMNLKEAQSLLGEEGRINAILALECNCASMDRLGDVRKEIAAILPETQVIEKGSQALARAEARLAAQKAAEQQFEEVREAGRREINATRLQRAELRSQNEAVAAALVPLVILTSVAWVALLTFMNVRERTPEVGILRAIGVRTGRILAIFLLKAVLMGIAGAGLGCLALFGLGNGLKQALLSGYGISGLLGPSEMFLVSVAAALVAGAAAWLPALVASQQDPAAVLRRE
jgi:ABC-type lipoprotein release transport system permease subunit